ncbi:DUF1194 domain-containing protein [Litoreibacter janthinus]|uniref:VWFA domain-containing protein n=1 Tax=Litoreibacter janthinus TaxID=670154 RepID=A0A1I6HGK3_9RHOB|nr:DUF1194 domain-containing protein [Litoreibacter janthinus]SFR53498.1 Protein of unknown function [Litoreibacter janthinus]
MGFDGKHRPLVGHLPVLNATILAWALLGGGAEAACRQALALGLDISGSVDAQEYRLQVDGLAAALLAPEVSQKALASPETPVFIAVYEWSGQSRQRVLINWTALQSPADLSRIATTLRKTRRQSRKGATAIGRAMGFADMLFREGPDCWTYTLDLSGDGKNNDGPSPQTVRKDPRFERVTINGLVIGSDTTMGRDERQMEIMELSAYYRTRVIHGHDAFIEVAMGFEDYQRAMERKLLRELKGLVLGALE